MPYLVIVRRDEPSLYGYLKHHLEEPGEVVVIPDRRLGERRRRPAPVADESRQGDRRGTTESREALGMPSMGFQIFPTAALLPSP